jgi:hypothetical protein
MLLLGCCPTLVANIVICGRKVIDRCVYVTNRCCKVIWGECKMVRKTKQMVVFTCGPSNSTTRWSTPQGSRMAVAECVMGSRVSKDRR